MLWIGPAFAFCIGLANYVTTEAAFTRIICNLLECEDKVRGSSPIFSQYQDDSNFKKFPIYKNWGHVIYCNQKNPQFFEPHKAEFRGCSWLYSEITSGLIIVIWHLGDQTWVGCMPFKCFTCCIISLAPKGKFFLSASPYR